MKALVISGGGSKGAFGGGIAEYLIDKKGRKYDLFIGTSTGSLLIPLLALGKIKKLRSVFTAIQSKDIFNISPFRIIRRNGIDVMKMHHLNVLRMFLRRQKTFGDSQNLRKTIKKTIPKADFEMLANGPSQVLVTVSNLSRMKVEYKSAHEHDYESFCDWIWISANMIPFMSLAVKNGMEYGDGGIADNIPIQSAIDLGAKEIDVIIHSPKEYLVNKLRSRNVFELTSNIFDFMHNHLSRSSVHFSLEKILHSTQPVKVNCYHTPRILTENALLFDTEKMKTWWAEGYTYGPTAEGMSCVVKPKIPSF